MKKFLGLTSLACASIFAFNVLGTSSASAATPPDSCFAFSGGTITDYYTNENNNSANPACPRDVDIPSTIGGVTVTNIGASAFSWDYTSDATKLTAVTIPNTVTNIDGYAFVNNKLTTITIPDAVATIGSGAFRSNQLSNVIVEGVLSSVADGVLTNNVITTLTYNGTTYTAPAGNTTPPDSCFAFNAGIITDYYYADLRQIANGGSVCLARDITIPGSIGGVAVTSLGTRGAYFGPFANKSLVNVIIPNSVTTIGSQAFFFNQLTDVVIPDSVVAIGSNAFNYNQLTNLTLGASVTTIDQHAFSHNKLTSLVLPDSLTTIGAFTFRYNQLTSVTIPDSITSIQVEALAFNRLTSVDIPSSVTSISGLAFINQSPAGGDFNYQSDDDYAAIWYTRLNVLGPNSFTLRDSSSVLSEPERGYDMNDDGDEDDTLYEGGHLINPASTTVTYKSSTGDILRPSQTVTGKTSDGRMLTDYLVSNGPSIPATEDPAQTRQPLQAYYRIGQSQTFTAPAITGYTGPVPASPYTTVSAVADNAVNFVYTAEADEGETPATPTQPTRPNQPGQRSDPAEEGELADTGFDARLLGVIAGLFMAVGLVIILGNSPRSSLVRSKM